MKTFILALALGLALTAAPARAEMIAADEASQHVGKTVTVQGVVDDVHHASSGKAIFLDFGGRYPGNTFTAVIFRDDFAKFPNVDSLNGKTVAVTGAIKLYKGKPEIVLNDPHQLKAK